MKQGIKQFEAARLLDVAQIQSLGIGQLPPRRLFGRGDGGFVMALGHDKTIIWRHTQRNVAARIVELGAA